MVALHIHRLHFSRKSSYEIRLGHPFISSFGTCSVHNSTIANKEKKISNKHNQLSPLECNRLRGDTADEFRQFVAQSDQEYWAAAWLRAECRWEGQETDRYVENLKRTFAEKEFTAMRRRQISSSSCLGDMHKCIVMVNKEDGVVGTLDLSIRHPLHGQTFPGEHVWVSLFGFGLKKGEACNKYKYGYIANLCVAKAARRRGIASNMLHFAVSSAKEDGAEKVYVHVDRKNKAAQVLYHNMGFQVVDAASSQLLIDQTYMLFLEASKYLD